MISGQKNFDGRVAFGHVARLTGYCQVTGSAGSSLGSWDDMIDLQREISFVAVNALTAPLLEQVFPDFISGQRPLLVLDPADLRFCISWVSKRTDSTSIDLIGASLP